VDFIVWGGIHGVGLVIEHWRKQRPGYVEPANTRRRRIIARVITFNIVCLAWVFFRADSFATAWDMLTGLFTGWGRVAARHRRRAARDRGRNRIPVPAGALPDPRDGSLRAAARARPGRCARVRLMLTNTMGPEGVAPFIYFRF
jgi:hypothetical protein